MSDKEHESSGHGSAPGGHGGGSHEEPHEGAPEWLISFADNTALMMGFFVIMLAMSMAPKPNAAAAQSSSSDAAKASGQTTEQLDWVLAVRTAFNNPVRLDSTDPKDQILVQRLRERLRTPSEDPGILGSKTKVQTIRVTDYRNLYGSIAFAPQSAELPTDASNQLDAIATKIRGMRLIVEIRGHASAEEAYNSNDHGWHLSSERACAVAAALSDRGITWKQLRPVACGDNDRIRPMAFDPQAHAQNETVEVLMTEEGMKD